MQSDRRLPLRPLSSDTATVLSLPGSLDSFPLRSRAAAGRHPHRHCRPVIPHLPCHPAVREHFSFSMDLADELREIVLALNAAEVPYAVCGGFAVIIYGFPRATQDIDLLVRDEDLPRLKETVRPLGFTLDSGSFTFKRGEAGESHFHRLVKVAGDEFLLLDLLAVTPHREDVFAGRVQIDWGEIPVSVVGREGLRRLKLDAGRPKDLEDLRRLGLEAT